MLMYVQSEFQHLPPGDFIISVEVYQPLKPALEILAIAKHASSKASCPQEPRHKADG